MEVSYGRHFATSGLPRRERRWASGRARIPAVRAPSSWTATGGGRGPATCPRPAGHQAGADIVRTIVTEAARLGLDGLTLYSFSIENWRRPGRKCSALMHLYADTSSASGRR